MRTRKFGRSRCPSSISVRSRTVAAGCMDRASGRRTGRVLLSAWRRRTLQARVCDRRDDTIVDHDQRPSLVTSHRKAAPAPRSVPGRGLPACPGHAEAPLGSLLPRRDAAARPAQRSSRALPSGRGMSATFRGAGPDPCHAQSLNTDSALPRPQSPIRSGPPCRIPPGACASGSKARRDARNCDFSHISAQTKMLPTPLDGAT